MKDISITLALLINACAILVLTAAVVGQGSPDCMARDRGMSLSDSGKPTSGMTEVKP